MSFDVADFLTWYVALIVALVIHEAAHAWVAMIGGDRTAYEAGQVTLNPVPHMQREPFGTILLPIMTYAFTGFPLAFAHAPYNPYWAEAHPRRAAIMSAAGPTANLLLALAVFLLMKLGMAVEWFELPSRSFLDRVVIPFDDVDGPLVGLAKIISVLFSINIILGIFNLIPVPPLDGAGIAEGVLPGPLGSLYRALRSNPMFALIGIIVAWQIAGQIIFPPWRWAVGMLG